MSTSKLPKGSILQARYEIIDLIGEGGFGLVYKARQISTNQFVAIKILLKEKLEGSEHAEIEVARFEREMQLIGKLKHPNIVRLIDSGVLDTGAHYAVLEYIEGIPLDKILKSGERIPLSDVKRIMAQVLEALSAAHAHGAVHRDLKPHNIMVTDTGVRKSAMVLDFGIAGIVQKNRGKDYRTLTRTGQFQGTPAYMAPEQVRGEDVTPQTDIYAWGLVLMECLTGSVAVDADSLFQIIFIQASDDPITLPDSIKSTKLREVLTLATAKSLEDRYPTAEEALADFELWSPQEHDVVIIPGEEHKRTAPLALGASTLDSLKDLKPGKPQPLLIGFVVLALLALGVVAIVVLSSDDETPTSAASAAEVQETLETPVALPEPDTTEPPPPEEPKPAFEHGQRYQPEGTQAAEMVFLDALPFRLGSPPELIDTQVDMCRELAGKKNALCDPDVFASQSPPRRVSIPAFFLDITEVTIGDYAACMEAGTCTEPDLGACQMLTRKGAFLPEQLDPRQSSPISTDIATARFPITCVDQREAAVFCDWAGKRLPTELEWELAALSAPHDLTEQPGDVVFESPELFPWEPRSPEPAKTANGADASLRQVMGWKKKKNTTLQVLNRKIKDGYAFSAPVGSFAEGHTAFEIADLSGNVREWTQSVYVAYDTAAPLPPTRAVTRGGGWADAGPFLSARSRFPLESTTRRSDLGFRCARSLELDALPPALVPGISLEAPAEPDPPKKTRSREPREASSSKEERKPQPKLESPHEPGPDDKAMAQKLADKARKLSMSGQPAKAVKLYAQALDLTPGDAQLRRAYAAALERDGHSCKALKNYKRSLSGLSGRAKTAVITKIKNLEPQCP